jgi:hypothetical protein
LPKKTAILALLFFLTGFLWPALFFCAVRIFVLAMRGWIKSKKSFNYFDIFS